MLTSCLGMGSLLLLAYRPLMAQEGDMRDQEIRAAPDRHCAASDANDSEAEHRINREDAVLEYPQSGERIRGRRNIQITRANQPSKKRFAVRRVSGSGGLWVTEYILIYDGKPSHTVSIMEFSGGQVARKHSTLRDPLQILHRSRPPLMRRLASNIGV